MPDPRIARVQRLAQEGALHGEALSEGVNDSHPGVRLGTLMAFDKQPVRMADFDVVRRLQYEPDVQGRAQCAHSLWRFGPIAEPVLIRMLEPDPADRRYEIAGSAAYGLARIGGEASLATLEAFARTDAERGSFRWSFNQRARDALLATEARLGRVRRRPRREGLWDGTPTNGGKEANPKVLRLWELAREDRLHGDVLAAAIVDGDAVWPRRQAVSAALEQETDVEDLPIVLNALNDPSAAVRGTTAGLLWRYGASAEPALIGLLCPPVLKVSNHATLSLERIGTDACLTSLRRLSEHPAFGYDAGRALDCVEARRRRLIE